MLDSHHSICQQYPVPCQYSCSTELFPRSALPSHYNECPRAPVSCAMAPFGCTERVQRSAMASHLQECAPKHATKMVETIVKLQKELENLKTSDSLCPSSGQFTWRIDEIREKIKSAQAGDPETSVIYSPPFYSSEAGYKLCLCIYPAGDHNHGYLSLYFVIMKGRFDEVLQWPFQKRVYLFLLNCR